MKKTLFGLLSCLSLAVGLLSAWLRFVGRMTDASYKTTFLLASLGWFVFATVWSAMRKKADERRAQAADSGTGAGR